jgi:hypothetical protein
MGGCCALSGTERKWHRGSSSYKNQQVRRFSNESQSIYQLFNIIGKRRVGIHLALCPRHHSQVQISQQFIITLLHHTPTRPLVGPVDCTCRTSQGRVHILQTPAQARFKSTPTKSPNSHLINTEYIQCFNSLSTPAEQPRGTDLSFVAIFSRGILLRSPANRSAEAVHLHHQYSEWSTITKTGVPGKIPINGPGVHTAFTLTCIGLNTTIKKLR